MFQKYVYKCILLRLILDDLQLNPTIRNSHIKISLIVECISGRELDPVYPEAKLEVVVQTILRVGCKSISHISVALNR